MAGHSVRRAVLIAGVAVLAAAAGFGVVRGLFVAERPGPAIVLPAWVTLPPSEPVRMAVLGTSLSYYGTWPDELAATLAACRDGPVTVDRVAMPGASSYWGLQHVERALNGAPHVLIIEFSINDASLFRGVSLGTSRRLHEAIIARAHSQGAAVLLATMNPAWGHDAIERPGQGAYRNLYRDLATQTGVGLVDATVAWQALLADRRAVLLPDGLHPTPEGMRTVALPIFAETLSSLLCDDAPTEAPRQHPGKA